MNAFQTVYLKGIFFIPIYHLLVFSTANMLFHEHGYVRYKSQVFIIIIHLSWKFTAKRTNSPPVAIIKPSSQVVKTENSFVLDGSGRL